MNSRRMPGTLTFTISEVSAQRTLFAATRNKRGYYDGKCNHREGRTREGRSSNVCGVHYPPEPVLYRDAIERIDSPGADAPNEPLRLRLVSIDSRTFDMLTPQITYRSIVYVFTDVVIENRMAALLSAPRIGEKTRSYFSLSDPIHRRLRDSRGFSRRKRDDIVIISFTIHPHGFNIRKYYRRSFRGSQSFSNGRPACVLNIVSLTRR